MPEFRVKPSKQAAIGMSLLGVVIVVVGVVVMLNQQVPAAAVTAWVVIGAIVIGFVLWSALSRRCAVQTVDSDSPPAVLPGTKLDREA